MRLRFDEDQRVSITRLGDGVAYLGYATIAYGLVQMLQCNVCAVVVQVALGVLLVRAASRLREGTLDGLLGGLEGLSSYFMVRIVLMGVITVVVVLGVVALMASANMAMDLQDDLQQIQDELNED